MQRNLRGILETLPKTLDETYERVLKDINEDNSDHARRLLHCLAVAVRPLLVEELAEILAFDFDDIQAGIPKFHAGWRWKDQEEAVLYTCSSLITVVDSYDWDYFGKCRVVQFSHFSVKEFLVSDRLASSAGDVSRYHILPGPAHTILVQACLGFLLHLDTPTDSETGKRFPLTGLTRYAAEHWVAHAQFEDVASHVKDAMRSLFDPDKGHFVAWVRIYNIDDFSPFTRNPLYHAALCGFRSLVEHLVISHPRLINTVGGRYDFPMLAALSNKHFQVAEFLLQHGAKVDIRGADGLTSLQILMDLKRGIVPEDIVDLLSFLLKHGADVNFRASDLSTSLHYATLHAKFEVVLFLLESGADIDSRDDKGRTPLHVVRRRDITRLLLEHGANVNAQDNDSATPLLVAAFKGFVDISRILLVYGAEPNWKNNDGETSLHRCLGNILSSYDHTTHCSLVRLLLGHGANVNDKDRDHTTPLHLAMESVSYEITQILIEHNAQPNVVNKDGKTPLHLVLELHSHSYSVEVCIARVVRLLLERGAELNAQDKANRTPLLLAIQQKMYDITRMLLVHGAEIDVKNNRGMTPLHQLLDNDFSLDFSDEDDIPGLTRYFLEHGADVNARGPNRATPLLLAAERHMYDVARILLERGANPNVKNIRGKTPMHLLLERYFHDHDDISDVLVVERLLLERGADVNAQDEDKTTPLYLADRHRRSEIAQVIFYHANTEKYLQAAQSCITLEGEYDSREKVSMVHGSYQIALHLRIRRTRTS